MMYGLPVDNAVDAIISHTSAEVGAEIVGVPC